MEPTSLQFSLGGTRTPERQSATYTGLSPPANVLQAFPQERAACVTGPYTFKMPKGRGKNKNNRKKKKIPEISQTWVVPKKVFKWCNRTAIT